MTEPSNRRAWLSVASTLLSFLACYGTLVIIAILGALGIAVAVNETLWTAAIVGFAGLAIVGLMASYRCHKQYLPLVLGLLGFAVVVYAMYFQYHRLTEVVGLALLAVAALIDWRLRNSSK
jgi:MerC mercury resistance protein